MTSTWSSVSRGIRRHGDDAVLEAVEVNDADWEVGHGVVAPEGGGAHRAHRGHGPGQPRHDPGPDEHPAIGGSWHFFNEETFVHCSILKPDM